MKQAHRLLSVFLAVILLMQLVAGALPALAITSTAELTDHSFHGEGLYLTEVYPNDVDRSIANDDRVANGCIPVTTYNSTSDLMEFIEVISTHDEDFKLNDVYEIYSNTHLLPITTMSGSSDITVTKGQPIVIWNERTDVQASAGITLPTEEEIRRDLHIPDNAMLLKSSHGGGWDNVATFTVKLKSTGEVLCTFTPEADVSVKDGLSAELKMPFWKSETTMELYRGMNMPSPGYVYVDQVRGYIKSIVPEGYDGTGVFITEIRPNDVNRSASYGTASDYMECLEITNTTGSAVTLNTDYQLYYSYREGNRKLLPIYQYSSSATNHVGSSSGCTVPAGGTAVLWCYRYSNLASTSTSFPTLSAFRNAYGIASTTPVYIFVDQSSLNNTDRALELFSVDAGGDPDLCVSSYFYNGVTDVTDNNSVHLKARHDGPGMAVYEACGTTTMGTVAAAQTSYLEDTGLGIELRLHDGVTIPEYIMEGEDLRINYYYEYDSRLSRLDTAVYYRFDGTGDWFRGTDGGIRVPNMYEGILSANELWGHSYVEFYIIATNPYRCSVKGVYRVNIKDLNEVNGIRTNISDGEEVKGTVSVTANDGGTNANTAIYIDGTQYSTTPMMEDGAYFTFYAEGRDAGFHNALTTTSNKLIANISQWQYAIPNSQVHHIDNSYFSYSSGNYTVTLRLWAGTTGTTVNEYLTPSANREDFKVSQLMLKLPNGKSYLPTSIGPSSYNGVSTSGKTNLSTAFDAVHCIGDSTNWCPYMNVKFTVPSSAVNAVGFNLDTTKLTDGSHTLKVTNGTYTKTVSFTVDNTAPAVNPGVSSGATLEGNITLNPTVTEANNIRSIVTTLDGQIIQTPYVTTARLLGAGSHTLQTVAEDAAGNITDKSVTFTVKDTTMSLNTIGSENVTHSTARLYLTAETGSATEATFYSARKIDTAAIQVSTTPGILPYIQYVIEVGEVDDNDEVMVSWDGRASGADDTHASTLFVRNIRSGAWDKVASADENGSIQNACFSARDHVQDGTATVIVQCTAESAMPDLDPATDGVTGNNAGWDGTGRPADYDFAFAWISDTQGYVQRYDYHFDNMTKWLADNAEDWKIKYVMHTGDVVDDWDHIYQWQNADRSMKTLEEAGIPYGVLAGNHDVAASLADNTNYWTYFGEDRVKDQYVFGGSYKNNLGHYDLVSQNGQDFIIVYMSWNIYDEEINWMNDVLAKYSDRKAILCFHAYTHTSSAVDGLLDYYGVMIRDHVVAKNPNVFAVLNGHYFGSTYQTVRFDDDGNGKLDRTVYQICTDYQSGWHGGAEYMKFFYFDLDNDQVYVNAYSSYYDEFNYYDGTGVHDLTAKAKAASGGVANATDVDILKMSVSFDTTQQTILEDSFSAYLATNEELGTAAVSGDTATLDVTGLTSETDHYWYADLNGADSGYLRTGVYAFTTTENPDFYLFGYINGQDCGCGADAANLGQYKFNENGKLVVIFQQDSYVAVKSGNNTDRYMAQSYTTDTSATLYKTTTGASEKMFVPAYMRAVFTLVDNGDGTLNLSYTGKNCTHNYDIVRVEPTCTEAGSVVYTCRVCTYTYTEELAAPGHQYVSNTVAPGCISEGSITETCTVCGSVKTETLPAVGHSYSAKVTTAPGCSSAGVKTFTCGNCGDTYTEAIAATGHSYKATVTAPTCTSKGYTTYTCACGDSYTADEIPVSDHSYEVTAVAPTCTAAGYTVHSCRNCDYSFYDNILPAAGHSYEAVVTAPTCTAMGYTTYTCTCGDSYTAEGTAALGHSYENGICTVCGAEDPDYAAPVVQPTLSLKYPTVSFEDVIVMNVYYTAADLEDVVEMGLITYSSNVSEWNIENAEEVIPGYSYATDKKMYVSSTNGIAAKCLGDTLYFAVYAKLSDGSYQYTKLVSYSPETYAYSQLSAGSADIKPLVVAMLKYGAAAQVYFNHNTDTLVDRNLTAEQLALIEDYRSDMMTAVAAPDAAKQGAFAANGGITRKYPTVSFEGAFEINYYCVPANTPVDGVTMYYWNQADYDAAEVLTAENATATIAMDGTGTYQAAVKGIAAKDLDKGIYVAFVYSDGTTTYSSGVLAYSIGTYCNASVSGNAGELAMATAVYGYHAKLAFYKPAEPTA